MRSARLSHIFFTFYQINGILSSIRHRIITIYLIPANKGGSCLFLQKTFAGTRKRFLSVRRIPARIVCGQPHTFSPIAPSCKKGRKSSFPPVFCRLGFPIYAVSPIRGVPTFFATRILSYAQTGIFYSPSNHRKAL